MFLQIDPFIHLSSAPCGPDGSNLNMLALACFFFFDKVFTQNEGEVVTPRFSFSLFPRVFERAIHPHLHYSKP